MTKLQKPVNRASRFRIRHPEKEKNTPAPAKPKPAWLRVKAPAGTAFSNTRAQIESSRVTTVCEEAACPNIAECWAKSHATFMLMGDVCTRGCAFCNVATGKPEALDIFEPGRVANAVAKMKLRHVVLTSVDRDDLEDGGADHFARSIRAVRHQSPETTVEILTPDFRSSDPAAIERVVAAKPDIFNHNIETVPSLYRRVRPGARYFHSLWLLKKVKELSPGIVTKSGLMVGMGESLEEVSQVLDDLRAAGVDVVTIGQYLQPSPKHHPMERFVTPQEFERLKEITLAKRFAMVAASPLTRSSYHAEEDFKRLKASMVNAGIYQTQSVRRTILPKTQFAVQMGMGTDLKGQDYTKAASRAVHDALHRNFLTIGAAFDLPLLEMLVDIRVGVPKPEKVDLEKIKLEAPTGTVTAQAVEGGLEVEMMGHSTIVANAIVTVSYDVEMEN